MFGLLKNNRPIIPTRLPVPDIPEEAVRSEAFKADEVQSEATPTLDVMGDSETKSENSITPPMTPNTDSSGDASTEELPTVEESTLREANRMVTVDDSNNKSEETPDSEIGVFEPQPIRMNNNLNGIFKTWLLFWMFALVVGLVAHFVNTYQRNETSTQDDDTPQDINFLLMPREKWDDSSNVVIQPSSFAAQRVVVLQTDTESCDTIATCSKLLNAMKRKEGMLPYNFLLATDGCVYEVLGWQQPSPLYPETLSLAVGFIGNYQMMAPSAMQLSQFQALLEASQELNYLDKSYTIIVRKQNVIPSKLFAYLSAIERWDKVDSDIDDLFMAIDFEPFPLFDV